MIFNSCSQHCINNVDNGVSSPHKVGINEGNEGNREGVRVWNQDIHTHWQCHSCQFSSSSIWLLLSFALSSAWVAFNDVGPFYSSFFRLLATLSQPQHEILMGMFRHVVFSSITCENFVRGHLVADMYQGNGLTIMVSSLSPVLYNISLTSR